MLRKRKNLRDREKRDFQLYVNAWKLYFFASSKEKGNGFSQMRQMKIENFRIVAANYGCASRNWLSPYFQIHYRLDVSTPDIHAWISKPLEGTNFIKAIQTIFLPKKKLLLPEPFRPTEMEKKIDKSRNSLTKNSWITKLIEVALFRLLIEN